MAEKRCRLSVGKVTSEGSRDGYDQIVPDNARLGVFRIIEDVGPGWIYWPEAYATREAAEAALARYRKNKHASMSFEDWRDACARFGAQVLRIMEAHQAWCADTMDEISEAAVNAGLATTDDNCAFRAIPEPQEE